VILGQIHNLIQDGVACQYAIGCKAGKSFFHFNTGGFLSVKDIFLPASGDISSEF
jgi:hypothetical protein